MTAVLDRRIMLVMPTTPAASRLVLLAPPRRPEQKIRRLRLARLTAEEAREERFVHLVRQHD